ncbi:MAG: OmpH family outer membrane protein [Alistipes sp.]
MKRLLLIFVLAIATVGTLSAQNYIIINSEKVFKSVAEYNNTIAQLDKLAEEYQTQVDTKFAEIETLYNNYMTQKASLSAAGRQARENLILTQEKAATEFQKGIFGTDGTLMKKRIEMIQPIQKRVFDAIEAYATKNGFDMVLDSANNATLLYTNAKVDHTQQIIAILK